jgi:serine/threonine-protein kinase
VDGQADQFSLAVVAYEIFTGEKPFAADHLPTLLYRIVTEDPAPLNRLNPTLAPQVDAILRKALSKKPAERFAECTQFVDALIKACSTTPDWMPMARGAMDSMPTVAGTVAGIVAGRSIRPMAPVAASTAVTRPSPSTSVQDSPLARRSLFRSLVWALVGIGIVGIALIGAQRFLMNAGSDTPTEQSSAAPVQEAPRAAAIAKPNPAETPSASPPIVSYPPADQPQSKPAETQASPPDIRPPAESAPADTESPTPPPHTEPAQPPRQARPVGPVETTVQIVTEPAGAHVIVDDSSSSSCTTPCMLQLSSGRHTMRADAAGYQTGRRIFTTPDQSDLFLSLDKAIGTLTVSSNPAGASIFLNGKELREKTPAVLSLPAGAYHVEIERDGRRIAKDVTVAAGEMHSLDLRLGE